MDTSLLKARAPTTSLLKARTPTTYFHNERTSLKLILCIYAYYIRGVSAGLLQIGARSVADVAECCWKQ
jgi:hypothetical protein